MKFSWKSLIGLIIHGLFLSATIIVCIQSLPYIERVPLSCLSPFICVIGLGLGNLLLVSQFGGKLFCELFNDKKATVTVPGCGSTIAALLAGASYFWGLVIISKNRPKFCHHEIPDNLWTLMGSHLVNGLLHVILLALLIIYRIVKCCCCKGNAERNPSEYSKKNDKEEPLTAV